MNSKIQNLLEQIAALEGELHAAVEQHESRLLYQIENGRVSFERSIKETHRKAKLGIFRWFTTVRPQNYLTAPIIYGMAIPMLLMDIGVTVYQHTCFPIYRIARVKRADYVVQDHQHLAYLNMIEKFHCMYCSYAVGVLAYATEITARTEQYFCPIKHARKILGAHSRYKRFLSYGDAEDLHNRIESLRHALAQEKDRQG